MAGRSLGWARCGFLALLAAGSGLGLAAEAGPEVVRLGRRDAIAWALRNNLQVSVARETREQARSRLQEEAGAFDPELEIVVRGERKASSFSRLQPGGPVLEQDTTTRAFAFTGKVMQNLPWGAYLDLVYAPAYASDTTSTAGALDGQGAVLPPFSAVTPFPYSGLVGASYTQKLLRGGGVEAATSRREAARKEAQAAEPAFRLAAISLAAAVEHGYWDLLSAQKKLANKRTALALAQRLLQENRLRVEVGALAAMEVTYAESQVAQAEQDIIASQAEVADAREALARMVFPGERAASRLELADDLIQDHAGLDEAAAVRMALERRLELKAAGRYQEAARIRSRAAADQVRPRLDAFVSLQGTSATQARPGALQAELLGFRRPWFACGLAFAVPLRNRAARGRASMARAALRKEELRLRDLELDVAQEAGQVLRRAGTARKEVEASGKTLRFLEQSLEAERRKFEHGLSTNFTVLQVMASLDKARNEELRARVAYARAVTAMDVALGTFLEARNLELD